MEYHPSLMVDGSGQLNIAGGAKTLVPKPDFATVRANQRATVTKEPIKKEMKIEAPSADLTDPTKNPYYDPTLGGRATGPRERTRKTLKFVQQGRFINEANQLRAKAQLEKLKRDIAESVKKTGMAVELDLVADQSMRTEPPPAVEWWDAMLVPDGYDNYNPDAVLTSENSIVSSLVQHPVPIQPPAEAADPKLKPLMLTKREAKKLRRQRRLELQKEKQDKIRLGLLPPEQSKLKISNLMMVLGTEAVQDPTKMEAVVRAQMAARKQKHKDLVASQKLTDEQRKEKKRKKLLEDTSNLVQVAVFRINDLTHPQHKYKVDINAQQLNLTGVAILYSGMNMVIVEGGPKGIKAYKKLMLKRIDWSNQNEGDDAADGEDGGSGPKAPNECALVWEGDVKDRQFKFFRFKNLPTEQKVKEFLEKMRAVHYWDAARNYIAAGV
ncbi:pre-mRNA processing factor 3-domain-containing protein [Powellomyces hirtus]|nr:pre-mRNA processing factor 3-domain-containing protein [Powellomyces hirtus]